MSHPNLVNDSNDEKKTRDNQTFIIALIIIVPYMIYFGIAILYYKDQSIVEKLAVLGSLVSAIVGYYFGQRPVKELTTRVGKIEKEKETTREKYRDSVNDVLSLASDLEQYKKEIENLKKLAGDK